MKCLEKQKSSTCCCFKNPLRLSGGCTYILCTPWTMWRPPACRECTEGTMLVPLPAGKIQQGTHGRKVPRSSPRSAPPCSADIPMRQGSPARNPGSTWYTRSHSRHLRSTHQDSFYKDSFRPAWWSTARARNRHTEDADREHSTRGRLRT